MELTLVKWAINVSVVGALLVLGYTVSIIVRRLESLEARLDKTDEKLNNIENELPYTFVSKEDWLRGHTKLETKIDRLIEAVIRLEAVIGKEKKE